MLRESKTGWIGKIKLCSDSDLEWIFFNEIPKLLSCITCLFAFLNCRLPLCEETKGDGGTLKNIIDGGADIIQKVGEQVGLNTDQVACYSLYIYRIEDYHIIYDFLYINV